MCITKCFEKQNTLKRNMCCCEKSHAIFINFGVEHDFLKQIRNSSKNKNSIRFNPLMPGGNKKVTHT